MESAWLDRNDYPFASHYLDLEMGRLHYIDEGAGPIMLFVHGTPSWSFEYRRLIKHFSKTHRCIALDHIGFGLSDKPADWSYRPADHARNLAALIAHLKLESFCLFVHDFGGPIGLSYALDHPEQIEQLVVFNTWMWSLADNPQVQSASKLLNSPIGKFLYKQLNASPKVLLKMVWANKATLTPQVHRAYTSVHRTAAERQSMYQLALELLGSSAWYESLWQRRERLLSIPSILAWGLKDATFGPELERWKSILPQAQVLAFADAGHFVMEEVPDLALQLEPYLLEPALI
jgi:pimeloyl-ACP methyl ester carboxylesterase